MNGKVQLELGHAYFEVVVQNINHYAMDIPER